MNEKEQKIDDLQSQYLQLEQFTKQKLEDITEKEYEELSQKLLETRIDMSLVSEDFDETFKKYIGKMNYVDVRHLEMPEPMTTILSELEQLPKDNCLMVDHKKVPQFLLPELKDRGFEILYNKKSENHLQLLIFRKV